MGKKKKHKKKNRKVSEALPENRKFVASLIFLVMVLVLGTVYYLTKPYGGQRKPVAPAFGELIEKRSVMNPTMFIGRTARAYRAAADIPKVLDSLFCYCYCKRNHGHKTLLTCFTNEHGSKCDICIGEALYACELYKQGKSLDDIIVAVDKKFYRPYRPHRI